VRRVEYYFRETASGMRRNGTIAFGAVMTAFIALFLFGLALLIRREISLVIEGITGNVQVAVYVDDTAASHPDTITHLTELLQGLPAVDNVVYEDKEATCERAHRVFAANPTIIENVPCSAYPTSLRVTLKDTSQYEQITAALACEPDETGKMKCAEPGVLEVRDFRDVLDRLSAITNTLSAGLFFLAMVMLVCAVVLVSNTLRMGLFARRKEISIMRLVGATNWRIRVPFLIEGGAEALLGAGLAIVALFLGKVFVVDQLAGKLVWLPLVRNSDVISVVPLIVIAAVVVAAASGTIGMRRFLDV
jgi:cell division transport system permease protein